MKEFTPLFREERKSLGRAVLSLLLAFPLCMAMGGGTANAYPWTIEADRVEAVVAVASQGSYSGLVQVYETDYSYAKGFESAYADISGEHIFFEGFPLSTAKVVYDASATALAAAGTGTLRIGLDSSGDIYAFGNKISNIGSSAMAYAQILETMHFYSKTGTPLTAPFPVTVTWEVHGTVDALNKSAYTLFNTAVGGPDWFITDWPYYREPYERKDDLLDGFAYFSRTVWMNPSSTAPAWGYDWWSYDPLDLSVMGYLYVSIAEGWAYFMSTGQFSITVPEGIAWVSSSGIFLTENNGPGPNPDAVPEPATALLLAAGLGGLALMKRRTGK
ncbi:MAG: VPLPA-CTERM sorting domain-containing protein [Geobacteraceae bacterium]|nr:VPLPA-CTERM sorting domain-containing protein [Geobacteraceae bacterium]